MQTENITIAQAATIYGTTPRNLSRKIGYNLSNPTKVEQWKVVGILDPSSVPSGQNDPFLEEFAVVLRLTPVSDDLQKGGGMEAGNPDRSTLPRFPQPNGENRKDPPPQKVVIQKKTVPSRPLSTPRVRPGNTPVRRSGDLEPRTLAEILTPDFGAVLIILLVLLGDGVSSGWIFYGASVDLPINGRYIAAVAFGFVGVVIGYAAVRSWIRTSDRENAGIFALVFALWHMGLHVSAGFGYFQIGQVIVYVGATIALLATIHSIR